MVVEKNEEKPENIKSLTWAIDFMQRKQQKKRRPRIWSYIIVLLHLEKTNRQNSTISLKMKRCEDWRLKKLYLRNWKKQEREFRVWWKGLVLLFKRTISMWYYYFSLSNMSSMLFWRCRTKITHESVRNQL